jgi:ParB family chromosome partitioning protein
MVSTKNSRLGRGLDHLIGGGISVRSDATEDMVPNESSIPGDSNGFNYELRELDLSHIIPNPRQARHVFNESKIRELADSIDREGLLQPIIVRPTGDGYYTIVAGERRFRALQTLKKKVIRAKIVDADEQDCAVISLIENLQRESLNPVEEALGFSHLVEAFHFTQEQIAQRVGKARTTIANALRLLHLEPEILHHLESGRITVGHAKVLLGVEDTPSRLLVLEKILTADLNVRQTERQANILKSGKSVLISSTPRELSESLMGIEKQIAKQLAANVSLQHGPTRGKIIIEYAGEQELIRIVQSMGIE